MPALVKPPNPLIIVVDDDAFAAAHINILLGSLGYRSRAAPSVLKGLAFAVKYRPKAILLDLSMPELDGFSFLAYRNKIAEIKDTPVIVLTASHDPDDVKRAVELSAAAYLVKPVELDPLARHLERFAPSPLYTPAQNSNVDWGVRHQKSLL